MRNSVIYLSLQSFILTVVICGLINISPSAFGQVMSSSNFSLQSDSVNFSGGYATSSSYTLEATVGEIATGLSGSASYQLRAGYQQLQEIYLALTMSDLVELSPSLPGITSGTSTGAVTTRVTTDNLAGYILAITTENDPAMQSAAGTIADYTPASSVPDFSFTFLPTEAVFGFTVEGSDIATRFQDNSSICGVAGGDTVNRCWDGLATSSKTIAVGTTSNHPGGATTTVHFQVGLGGMITVPAGIYVATSTLIAIPQ